MTETFIPGFETFAEARRRGAKALETADGRKAVQGRHFSIVANAHGWFHFVEGVRTPRVGDKVVTRLGESGEVKSFEGATAVIEKDGGGIAKHGMLDLATRE